MMKVGAILSFCSCLASSSAFAQALPPCPPEPESIKDVSLAHLDRIMLEYKENMRSKGLVLQALQSELKSTGKWNQTARQQWEHETEGSPEFIQSVTSRKAAEAAEDAALREFILAMGGPRDMACQAMTRYFQFKLDYFAENYKQLDIGERAARSQLNAIRASESSR